MRRNKSRLRGRDTIRSSRDETIEPDAALFDSRGGRLHKRPHQRYCLGQPLFVRSTEFDVFLARAFQGGTQSLRVLDTTILQHTRAVVDPRHFLAQQQDLVVAPPQRRFNQPWRSRYGRSCRSTCTSCAVRYRRREHDSPLSRRYPPLRAVRDRSPQSPRAPT